MRKNYFLKTLLLLAVILAGASSAWADTTYKLQQVTSVSAGNKYVFVQSGHAMGNTISSSALQTVDSYKTTGLAGNEAYVWTLETANGGFYMKNVSLASNAYLNNTSSKTDMSFGSKSAIWTFTFTDGVALIQNSSNSNRFLGYTTATSYVYKAYSTSNNGLTNYQHAITVYQLVEESGLTNPDLTVDNISMEPTETISTSDLYLSESDGAVSFESDDETVAKIEDGLLKALKPGTAKITVSQEATEEYDSAEETFTVTVTAKDAVSPIGPASTAGYFEKVKSTAAITDGEYLIVYETGSVAFDGGLETLDAASNNIAVTISDEKIAATDATLAAKFTIDVTNGKLKSASGNYIGVSSNSNGLKQSDAEATYTNSFAIDDDKNAVIPAVYDGSTMSLRYNKASDNLRFRYYKNAGQEAIQLYKYVPGSPADQFDVTISDAGYKTLVSTVDFKTQTGTTAYIVTASSASSATLTSVSEVPAGTPVILKGSGTVTLDVIDNAAAVNGNLLQVSTESTGNGVYVLADKDGVGFYKWTGGSLGAGRVYLPAPAAAAREFLSFDFEETTGINNVESSKLNVEGFYNLAGQRVAQPTKGLYIVNGKKVIIK